MIVLASLRAREWLQINSNEAARSSRKVRSSMFDNYASGASGSRRFAPFLSSNSHVTEESRDRAQNVLQNLQTVRKVLCVHRCFIFVFILAASSAARLSAQTSGSISGHVADQTGAVIPQANVTLTNVGTSGVRTTATTGSGDYLSTSRRQLTEFK